VKRKEGRVTAESRLTFHASRDIYDRHPEEDDCAGAEPQLAGDQSRRRGTRRRTRSARWLQTWPRASTSQAEPHPARHLEEWITLPIREGDHAAHTARKAIRVPTVIVAVNFAKVPKKRPKLSARNIRERDPLAASGRGQPRPRRTRSRGGADTWENLVWSAPAAALVKTFVDLAIAQGPASMGFDRVTSGY
jgi:5-methylcytosine-specific restriction endonuclease McrA